MIKFVLVFITSFCFIVGSSNKVHQSVKVLGHLAEMHSDNKNGHHHHGHKHHHSHSKKSQNKHKKQSEHSHVMELSFSNNLVSIEKSEVVVKLQEHIYLNNLPNFEPIAKIKNFSQSIFRPPIV